MVHNFVLHRSTADLPYPCTETETENILTLLVLIMYKFAIYLKDREIMEEKELKSSFLLVKPPNSHNDNIWLGV